MKDLDWGFADTGGGENPDTDRDSSKQGQLPVGSVSGMYQDWFLDYASYVILERAVPDIHDGLKPVQRRILHSMRRMDDGRFNKVANIIGHTMQFHPHGDASIGDALVQIGQKDLLVDTQGNWGNILTGDSAAAPRYIEARLSKFAGEVLFNPKTTEWKASYDGRNREPVTLPAKFPVLLFMGVEGIAVGLASKILPHNFNEIIDASIAYLQRKEFVLYPDFPTGGLIDVVRYNDGQRGGIVKSRARIEKIDKKGLVITELPYGKTTGTLIDSIIRASEKGKIKIRKIDDNTSGSVEIVIHLVPGTSPDKTIDALYAFTDCEVSISPNSCVIANNRPSFLGVSDILRFSADQTVRLLKQELEIKLDELGADWHFSSLEKIFIENRIYHDIEECDTWEGIIEAIDRGLGPFKSKLRKEVTRDDIIRLTEIRIKRISKYDSARADEHIKNIETEMSSVRNHLSNIIHYTISYYRHIKKKYGSGKERKSEIRSFDTIQATRVAASNARLYVNRKEGFLGTGLKKDEFVCECSDIDDIIVFRKDGTYLVTKIAEKLFVGRDIEYLQVFRKNEERTIYNIVYQDGREGPLMAKRCAVTGLTRDREYNMTRGTPGSRIMWLTANPNGEAEIIKIFLKPRPKLKKTVLEFDFVGLAIKGRSSIGNIVTRNPVLRVTLKEKGLSTLGGRKIWFDDSVNRLNDENRGKYLGEFSPADRLLVVLKNGSFRTTGFDLSQHFEDNILLIEKYNSVAVFSTIYWDADQGYYYVKRFSFEDNERLQFFISDNSESRLVSLTEVEYPRFEIRFGGKHQARQSEIIEVAGFIAVKGFKARGKRLTNFTVDNIKELEPVAKKETQPAVLPEEEQDTDDMDKNDLTPPKVTRRDDPAQMKLEL